MANDIMTIREVAEYLRLNDKTTYRYAAEGKIPGFKIGGAWRFRREEIVEWTKAQSKEGLKAG
jgi:excisionase family DNA binding protein